MSIPVTVLVSALDEEERLPGALASVEGWAEEILVVVDPRTKDRSREIAAGTGARVLEHPFESSGAQSNWGIERCRTDWVFVLDADERVTSRLKDAIRLAIPAPAHAAYAVRRINFAFGRPLRFGDWGSDEIVRLIDRRQASFVERAVHGAVTAPSVGRLRGAVEHHTLQSLAQYLPKLNDYALRGAADLLAAGRKSTLLGAVMHAKWRFVRSFVVRLGFLDGAVGFVVAGLAAYGTFLKWAVVWESSTQRRPRS
ncbi:MAG: glycosyltransferase family 2 protein [Thermoanaerobaculaceae bacterium]